MHSLHAASYGTVRVALTNSTDRLLLTRAIENNISKPFLRSLRLFSLLDCEKV